MRYRSLTDIFPVGYPFLPDEEEVRRQCLKWWYQVFEAQSLLPLTEHLSTIVDPFVREYSVSAMHAIIEKELASEDSEIRISPDAREALENDFRRIIRRAHTDQLMDKMDTIEQQIDITPLPNIVTSYSETLVDDVAFLKQEVARLSQIVEQRITENAISSLPTAPVSINWTFIDLWLMPKNEIADENAEDYTNFHTVLNGYIRQGAKLDDILHYLLSRDGKILHLPRHKRGKSAGRINQAQIREVLEQLGIHYEKSNYSRILIGL